MNLDKILANSTYDFPPITNFPPVTFQIKVADSRRKMKEDERGRPTKLGAVYPDDRRILVNSEVINDWFWIVLSRLTKTLVCNNSSIPKYRLRHGTMRVEYYHTAADRHIRPSSDFA